MALGLALSSGPVVAADTDGDGLRDAFEKRHGLTSHLLADSDGDGVIDAAEDHDGDDLGGRGEQRFKTDPGDRDSDDDGVPDGREDADGDGTPNAIDQHRRPLPAGVRPAPSDAFFDVAPQAPDCGVPNGERRLDLCHFGDRESKVEVVLVGDSKATMYLPPAIVAAEQEGWHLTTMLKGRCTPVLGTMARFQRVLDGGLSCRRWRNSAFEHLRGDPPDLIVLVFSDDYVLVDRKDRKLDEAQKRRALRTGLEATLAALPSSSQVVLLADAPRSTINAPKCLERHPRDMSACLTLRPPASAARIDTAIRRGVRAGGGTYRTLEDRICPYQPCPLVQGDILIYKDKGHLTVTFTEQLAPSLRAELAPFLAAPADPQAEPPRSPQTSAAPSTELVPDPSPTSSEPAA
ncbi:MAG: SGNH hydrolase domain-containing protein [Candidatus Limnocylindrales bacterium]